MARKKLFALKRPKIRQSWNKYNLYNLAQYRVPIKTHGTYFQQKWVAKAATRAYHGQTIKEGQWKRMFRPKMNTVVAMDSKYLAQHDGSELAMGRGSGLDVDPTSRRRRSRQPLIPYMNMVYALTERRLDTAIFRALFASSTRQARQFVVHGYVKVNGQKMVYPGYQLNPGDMFQVDPERVLYATGARKDVEERRAGRKMRKQGLSASDMEDLSEPDQAETSTEAGAAEPSSSTTGPGDVKASLQSLMAHAKAVLSTDTLASAKRKQELRAFKRTIRSALSRPTTFTDSIDAQLLELTEKLNLSEKLSEPPAESSPATEQSQTQTQRRQLPMTRTLASDQERLLRQALAEARDNPVDPTKPYSTPWRPREYMSAFAFVPRYLEVHHRVCSAVYLRHPVARAGVAEVPSPFNQEMNGLAFNWYLRRR